MGERWGSPPTYSASGQDGVAVEARALAVDAEGRPVGGSATWTSADPDMVAVSPRQGNQVNLTVHRAGRSSVAVAQGASSKTLTVSATQQAVGWRVEISQ